MKKEYYLEKNIIIILAGIEVVIASIGIAWLEDFRYKFSYDDLRLIVQLFTGVAPFVAAFSAYWMWSKNREKELKQLDYKNDYYKKIIDKRIEAYDELQKLLSLIDQFTGMKITEEVYKYYHYMYSNNEKIEKVIEQIEFSVKKNMWLDENTLNLLNRINILVVSTNDYLLGLNETEIYKYYVDNYDSEEKYINKEHYLSINSEVPDEKKLKEKYGKNVDRASILIGILVFEEMSMLCNELRYAIYKSMLVLYNIDDFLRSNENNKHL